MNTTTEIQAKAFEARATGNMSHEAFIAVNDLLAAIDNLAK